MKRVIVTVMVVCMMMTCCCLGVYANGEMTCSTAVNGRYIQISGQIPNMTEDNQVTLFVGSTENIVYVSQKFGEDDGSFTFDFNVPPTLPSGKYPYKIGNDTKFPMYEGVLEYSNTETESKFVDIDLTVSINGYVPSITGTMNSGTDTTAALSIKNVTDSTDVINTSAATGDAAKNISCTLPSLLKPKTYNVELTCTEGEENLAVANIELASSTVLVSVSGNIAMGDNARFNVQIESTNTDLINKNMEVTGNKDFSATLPNIISGATYHVKAQGYRIKTEPPAPPAPEGTVYEVTGTAKQEVSIAAKAENIAAFAERSFTLEYNPDQLLPVSLFGLNYENTVATGQKGKVKIESYEPGKIVFSIHDTSIAQGKVWTGVLNVFKFRFADSYSGTSTLTLQ